MCKVNHWNTELNPICHLFALLRAHHILHVSGIRVNLWNIHVRFPYFKPKNALTIIQNKTDCRIHFIFDNSYMFQHQGAFFREFINNEGLWTQHISHVSVTLTSIIKTESYKTLHCIAGHEIHCMLQPDEIPLDHILAHVCLHNSENINNCKYITTEAHYCVVLLLKQYGLVLNICNLEF